MLGFLVFDPCLLNWVSHFFMKELVNIISSKECNNDCLICARAKEEIKEMSVLDMKKQLKDLSKNGCKEIILTGGEPTLMNDFLSIIEVCAGFGFSPIHIQTNGRRFSDINFAKKVSSFPIIDIFLSIHGDNADIHEKITNSKGSFDQSISGIENLISLGANIRTNTVITKPNAKILDQIARFLIKKGVLTLQFSLLHPKGRVDENPEMIPSLKEMIPSLEKALSYNSEKVKVFFEAIPFCLLKSNYNYAAEWLLPKSYREVEFDKMKGDLCSDCKFYEICPGIWKSYTEKIDFNPFL